MVALSTRLRTASLTQLAASLGALAAGAASARVTALGEFGRDLGIALQMLDDLGGSLSPGRQQKGDEDLRLGRPTWPWAWAAEAAAPADLAQLLTEAGRVHRGETDTRALRDRLARAVTNIGRGRVHAALETAQQRLAEQIPPRPRATPSPPSSASWSGAMADPHISRRVTARRAAVVGSGFGGLAVAIRLQAAGIATTLFEARDLPGGRAYVYRDRGFTFDAGPTVITAPTCLEELAAAAGRRLSRLRRALAGHPALSPGLARRRLVRLRRRRRADGAGD